MDNDNQKEVKPKTVNKWISHCRQVASDNPDLAYKDVLRKAKETYTKVEKPAKPIKEKIKKGLKPKPNKSDSDTDSVE